MSEIWIPSPNYSGRNGSVGQLTFHTSEGAQDGYSLGNFLSQESSQVSYHAAVDNTHRDTVFRYVDSDYKAWAQANYNDIGVSVCFCTPSGAASNWSRETWLSKTVMLENAAQIGRRFADLHGIPLTELSSSQAQNYGRGVDQHANLGAGGSNHHDCGLGRFPMDVLIDMMKGTSQPPSQQPPTQGQEAPSMVAAAYWNGKLYLSGVGNDGKVKFWNNGFWQNVDQSQSGAKHGSASLDIQDGKFVIGYVNGSGAACTYENNEGLQLPWHWAGRSDPNVFG